MAKRDYYEVLGVSREAGDDDLKKAYRRLAMKHHPDRNEGDSGAEAKFKEAKEAFEVLGDAETRSAYDQFGHAGVDASMRASSEGGGGFGDIFDSVFGDIFGGGARSSTRVFRGADLRYELPLSLEDAAFGTTTNIRVPSLESCEPCNGSGAKRGTSTSVCTTCGGHGQVRAQQGFFSVQQTCPACRGAGKVITDPCPDCRGAGRKRSQKTLSVKVPAGVDTGDRIRLTGEGEPGESGGPPGDLYVTISLKEHPIFQRDGNDLLCEVPINIVTASLGGDLEVPTLDGRIVLKIPEGAQTGRAFRLRGKGVKAVRGGAVGDMLCRIVVETPIKLKRDQKALLKEFGETMGTDGGRHSPKESSWLYGVRKFFDDMKA